jgi:hypothetical protein
MRKHLPSLFCWRCRTLVQLCPCGVPHDLYVTAVCGVCTATGGMPAVETAEPFHIAGRCVL